MSCSTSPVPALPVEVWTLIFEHLPHQQLKELRLLGSIFEAAANKHLFASLSFTLLQQSLHSLDTVSRSDKLSKFGREITYFTDVSRDSISLNSCGSPEASLALQRVESASAGNGGDTDSLIAALDKFAHVRILKFKTNHIVQPLIPPTRTTWYLAVRGFANPTKTTSISRGFDCLILCASRCSPSHKPVALKDIYLPWQYRTEIHRFSISRLAKRQQDLCFRHAFSALKHLQIMLNIENDIPPCDRIARVFAAMPGLEILELHIDDAPLNRNESGAEPINISEIFEFAEWKHLKRLVLANICLSPQALVKLIEDSVKTLWSLKLDWVDLNGPWHDGLDYPSTDRSSFSQLMAHVAPHLNLDSVSFYYLAEDYQLPEVYYNKPGLHECSTYLHVSFAVELAHYVFHKGALREPPTYGKPLVWEMLDVESYHSNGHDNPTFDHEGLHYRELSIEPEFEGIMSWEMA